MLKFDYFKDVIFLVRFVKTPLTLHSNIYVFVYLCEYKVQKENHNTIKKKTIRPRKTRKTITFLPNDPPKKHFSGVGITERRIWGANY